MTRILATTALALLAGQAVAQPLPSPNFLTPQAGDNSSRAATTAWVRALVPGAVTSAQVAAALGYSPLMSGGDISPNMVLAAGSSIGRSAAVRAATVFNILDYGAVADGSTDIGPALNLIASKLGAGKSNVILIPAGNYRLASAVVFNGVAPILQGQGFTAGPSPQSGTWITIDRTGFVPFTFSGVNARGAVVRDIAIRQAQPAVGAGWAPTGYDYVFKVLNALGEVTFDNLLFAGVTRGIYADYSGRLHIRNVAGQFYTAGIEIDDCYDIPRIEYLHAWTYQTSDPNVLVWQEANLDTIILRRVDGIFLGDIFSLAARSVLHLTAGANGVTTKFYLNNLYADFVTYGVWIDAPGVTGQIANATTQHNDFTAPGTSLPGSTGLLIDTTGVSVQIGNWRTQLAQSSGLTVRQSGNRLDIASLAVNGFDNLNDGSPAISVADSGGATTNVVNIVGQPNFTGGGAGPALNIGNAAVARAALMSLPGGAVNEPRLYAAASGNPVSLAPIGPDANVDLYMGAKGSAGSLRLRAQNSTVVRLDSPGPGDTDLLFRSATGTISGIVESASANADILLSSKGPTSSVRLQSQGITSLRTASPGPGDSDLYVLGGSGAVALVGEGAPASVNLSLASKGFSGQIALQSNGLTTLRTDNPNTGDTDLLVRPGNAAINLITESAATSADLLLSAKGPNGGIRFQAQGGTVVRLDNPGTASSSDLLIRNGAATVALTVEDPGASANLVLNPKGSGTVVLGTTPAATDNSANVVSSAWVKAQSYLTIAPVTSVATRVGAITLTHSDLTDWASATSTFLTAIPAATTATIGGVKPDGTTILNSAGAVSVAYGVAANTAAQGNDARIIGALAAATAASTYAPLVSPALSGTPTVPTATAGTSSAQIASTAFVGAAVAAAGGYSLPPATASVLGGVKPDGTTLTNSAGAISTTYGTATNTAAQGNDARITGALSTAKAAATYYLQTNPSGYLTNITSGQVTGALGFTPYNATNPTGYQTAANISSAISAAAYSLPPATASALGGVRPDGVTIANSSGGISVAFGTVANTASQGNDSRITGALSASTAATTYYLQTNPSGYVTATTAPVTSVAGLSGVIAAATLAPALAGASGTTLAAGNDARITGALAAATAASTYAPLVSPALSGTPTVPTATAGTSSAQIASTAFVGAAVTAAGGYTLPTATSTTLGGVRPDGVTINNTAGVLTVPYGAVANTAAQGNDGRITGALQVSAAGPLATQVGGSPAAAVTAALGFTPYNSANPAGYVTALGAATAAPVQSVAALAGAPTAAQLAAALGGTTGTTLALGNAPAAAVTAALPSVAATTPLTGTGAAGGVQAATGTLVLPSGSAAVTQAVGDITTSVATDAFAGAAATAAAASKAPSVSPTFTGTVTIPAGASISGFATLASPTFTGSPVVPGYATTVTDALKAPLASPNLTGTLTVSGTANNLTATGASTGSGVVLAATGTDTSVDLSAQAQGGAGSVRLRANGVTVLRTDSPGGGTSDLLVRSGSGTVALTVEGAGPNANLALNPQGSGVVVVPTAAASDNSTTVASTAFVKAQGYLSTGVLEVDAYTASGTWTLNPKATYIRATLIGCGSSGAGGVTATAGTAYSGGAGGSAATALVIEGPASQFTSGAVALCTAPAGGAAGIAGSAGGNAVWNGVTAYGGGAPSAGAASITAASGGSGGLRSAGGNASGATAGSAGTDMGAAGSNIAGNSASVSIPWLGGTGGAGLTSGVGSGGYVLSGPTGGGAGGYMAAAQALTSGGNGGPIRSGATTAGGATAGAPGTAGGTVPEGYGSGGGGGANNTAGVGGIGGAGATGAGGGGGGDGSTGGGTGGAGGGPLLRVVQW